MWDHEWADITIKNKVSGVLYLNVGPQQPKVKPFDPWHHHQKRDDYDKCTIKDIHVYLTV